jgi:predicted ribosome quality control (RQC) complex YloA/Tae2 family protein
MSILNLATEETAVLLMVLLIALGLVRILEAVISKVMPSKTKVLSEDEYDKLKGIELKIKTVYTKIDDKPTLTDTQNTMLRDLHELHSRTDADGVPLHYFPRSFIEAQKEIVDVLQEISSHQEKTTYLLESLIKKIERLEDKLEHYRKDS